MATEEETYKLIIQFENEEKLKTVAASAALAEQKFKALHAQLGAGAAQTKAAAASLSDLNGQMSALKTQADSAQRSTRDWGRATLEASRGLEDLQYGVAGVLNNIPTLIQTLGGGAGLAGAISVAAVAGKVLYDHWDDVTRLFGSNVTKTEAQQMEELGKQTSRTADETERLLKYEERRKSLDAQREKPDAQKQQAANIDKAIQESPELAVRQAIDKVHGPAIRKSIDPDIADNLKMAKLTAVAARSANQQVQRNPNASDFEKSGFKQQVVDKEAAEKEAQKAWDEAYNKARDKIQGNLANDLVAFKAFVKTVEDQKLLPKSAIAKLKLAARTPQEIKEDAQQDQFDQATSKAAAAARQRAFEKDEEVRRQGEASDKKEKDEAERAREKDIAESLPGLQQKFSPEILANVARGTDNDPLALSAKISRALQAGGKSKDDADDISDDIADKLIKGVEGRTRERSNQEGLTKEEAASREAEDDAASARSRAPRAHGAITDASGFAHSLQMALFNKADPIQQAILDVNRKAADNLEKLVEETRKQKPRQSTAVAAGPA